MIKKSENKNYSVMELIHSTDVGNIPSIEKNNLDWKLVRRTKYGYGVSFSYDADYANTWCSKKNGKTAFHANLR